MDTSRAGESPDSSKALFLFGFVVGSSLVSCLYLAVVRLYLSPVAKVPGPKLAALTFWYEFYYDVWLHGQYTFKIKELHKQYGPVIRINPYEVHIADPDYYDKVYVGAATRPTDKWYWTADAFLIPSSTLATIPSALHRRRRAMFSAHFSVAAIQRLESVIRATVDKLMDRFDQAESTKEPIWVMHAYSAMTMDIITSYCFARSMNTLDLPGFADKWDETFFRIGPAGHFVKQFLWLIKLMQKLPSPILTRLSIDQARILNLQDMFTEWLLENIDQRDQTNEKKKPAKPNTEDSTIDNTIFDSMLDADVPESEKGTERLAQEAQLIIAAGTVTTAHTLMTATYHLLANPPILAKLKEEIRKTEALFKKTEKGSRASRSSIPLKTLEQLPYMNAVLREALRLSYGVPHRLQRISPTTTIHCHGYALPPGTPVSMSTMIIHDNEEIFVEPERFNPDRWLPMETTGAQLFKYLTAFSKGSRQCVGMNLAWAEMYLLLATLFGSQGKDLQLYETVYERDVKVTVDGFTPCMSAGSEGPRVIVGK